MGRHLSVPDKHKLAIAKKTINMPDAIAAVMGPPTKKEALEIIRKLDPRYYQRLIRNKKDENSFFV